MTIQKDIDLLVLILQEINNQFKEKIIIHDLINKLEGYLRELSFIETTWINDALLLWSELEIVYASDLAEGLKSPHAEGKKIIKNSLECLKKMTESKLHNLRMQPNSDLRKAEELRDNWLMCPLCQEAWETTTEYALIKCPGCKQWLHNPKF